MPPFALQFAEKGVKMKLKITACRRISKIKKVNNNEK